MKPILVTIIASGIIIAGIFGILSYQQIESANDFKYPPPGIFAGKNNTAVKTNDDPFMSDIFGKVDLSRISPSTTQDGQIDYGKIGHMVSENKFKKMLDEKNIRYDSNDFILIDGITLTSYPPISGYCGYVIDTNNEDYWFSSTFHKDTITDYVIFEQNPEPCKPSTHSCFCSLQYNLAEKNLELSYFTTAEEETVGKLISNYLNHTKISNVSNQFVVGKYNLESESADIHYCGAFTWGVAIKHFEGYIKNGNVMDFGLASEKPKLCTINDNAKMFTFDKSSLVQDPAVNPLQMAKSFLHNYMSDLRITAIGIDETDMVLEITIHDEELKRIPNAKEFYENKIKQMLPFDVPIKIKFGHTVPAG